MRSNPFSTRYVRPGELAWIADNGQDSPEVLVKRFCGPFRKQAAIVGPHGSGKSTLLEHLVPLLGNQVDWLSLRRGQRPMQKVLECSALHSSSRGSSSRVLVLDGFEQLSTWQAIRVCWMTRRLCQGLLVTCHQRSRLLPTLVTLTPTAELVHQLVIERLSNSRETEISGGKRVDMPDKLFDLLTDRSMLQRWLAEERGSVREVLMRLYDRVEDHYATSLAPDYSHK